MTASLALQFGCPVDTLHRALTRLSHGLAAGTLAVLLEQVEALDMPEYGQC